MTVLTLGELAGKIGGELHGDPAVQIHGTAKIDEADEKHITFLANSKYRGALSSSRAAAVIIDEKLGIRPEIPYIVAPDAYFGFLQAVLLFQPHRELLRPEIHSSAVIDAGAHLGENVSVGAHCYIGPGVTIGDRSQIYPNCTILNDASLGEECIVHPSVTIREDSVIGNRVILQCGAVIGSDGFGFAPYEGKFHKIPQLGRVVLEDDVEIGANATIDRATMGDTVIKTGTKLDNLVQVAHNVVLGKHSVIAAQTGISGSSEVGDHAMIGGQVGIVGHIKLGNRVRVGAQSGISKSMGDDEVCFGTPARPIMKAKKIEASLNSLPELRKRVKELETAMSRIDQLLEQK